jgi:hypothetical protein
MLHPSTSLRVTRQVMLSEVEAFASLASGHFAEACEKRSFLLPGRGPSNRLVAILEKDGCKRFRSKEVTDGRKPKAQKERPRSPG